MLLLKTRQKQLLGTVKEQNVSSLVVVELVTLL